MKRLLFSSIPFLILLLSLLSQEAMCQQSIPELEQQLKLSITNKDNGKISFYTYEIAKLYIEEGKPQKAITYLTQCVANSKGLPDKTLVYLAYQRLGIILREDKNYNKSLDYFLKALQAAEDLDKSEFVSEGLLQVVNSYVLLGKYKKTISSLEQALSIGRMQNDFALQQKCYELLSSNYDKLGNKAKSIEYKNLYKQLLQGQQQEIQSEKQRKVLEHKIVKSIKEKETAYIQLADQAQKLRRTEDSLLTVKYSLEEKEQSLARARALNERRKLQIDLLNKDKELTAIRIEEQNVRFENEALIKKFFFMGGALTLALALVIIYSYRRKIESNKKIELQNISIKSSINYARRIQEAMLPKVDQQKNLLPESFILFKPRDSVSGDFYWLSEIKSWYNPDVVFAAVDCTGHGIPGAFMSMIGINALNGIISRGIAEPDQILRELDKEIRTALQQEMSGNNDGMDVALCIYRKEKNIVEFSGAKNPLIYIQNKTLSQIKGDVHSIGGGKRNSQLVFKKHNITIDQPTMMYLFSDGYRDQFGGKDNTKFMSKNFYKLLMDIHELPLDNQKLILDQKLEEWKDGRGQTDDVLVMGIRLEPVLVG